MNFIEYPKMARWSRDVIVTEKIDGTNAQILIELWQDGIDEPLATLDIDSVTYNVWAGSRNRWLTAKEDNHGFAKWVLAHTQEIVSTLGPGRHYGEWWGPGIQRGYGLREKQFSLFNVSRWKDLPVNGGIINRVPILYEGPNEPKVVENAMLVLETLGSQASPGFMRPEGIVWWHTAGNVGFKKTFENDEKGKGQ